MNAVERYLVWFNRLDNIDNVIKRITGISYSISREMSPVFTMGSPEPVARMPRRESITGTLSIIANNNDELMHMVKTIEKCGIKFSHDQFHKNIWTPNTVEHTEELYELQGIDILNTDTPGLTMALTMSSDMPYTPAGTNNLTFVARSLKRLNKRRS
jgi:hypothetical protein